MGLKEVGLEENIHLSEVSWIVGLQRFDDFLSVWLLVFLRGVIVVVSWVVSVTGFAAVAESTGVLATFGPSVVIVA